MAFWGKVANFFGWERVRARDEKGRFVADDKSTPDVDESKKRVYKKRSTAKKKTPAKRKPRAKKSYKPKTDQLGE